MHLYRSAAVLAVLACIALTPAAVCAQADDASRRLHALFAASNSAAESRFPIGAIYRGEARRVAQFGEYLTDAFNAANEAAAREDLRALAAVDRAALGGVDRIAYDAFKWQREADLRWYQPHILGVWLRLPFDQVNGLHLSFPELSSGTGAARYRTAEDYEDGLGRIDGYVAWLDRAIARFREGAAAGFVHPRPVVERLIAQFAARLEAGVEGSPFYGPVRAMPAGIAPGERERIARAYAAAIRERVLPAYARMHDFLGGWYLKRARDTIGVYRLPGGEAYYRHLVHAHTTQPLSPDELHALGRREVERLRGQMDAIRTQAGFDGTLAAFFDHLRTDPRFRAGSVEALAARYRAIGERVAAALPKLFPALPKAPLEIREELAMRVKSAPYARYVTGAADGSRPGIFYFNPRDLAARTIVATEALYLHEALPGHHLQMSLAREDARLPAFLRFRDHTVFTEGWALYAETLGAELGLYTDPYQRFGALDQEMWRALRLVVDTGIHWMGWRRDEAIDYMMANSTTGRVDATAEVERYIAWPGQALAYKVGQLAFTRLRAKAQAGLGEKFDLRAFHGEVLSAGSLPLPVLEAKVDAWIAAVRTAGAAPPRSP